MFSFTQLKTLFTEGQLKDNIEAKEYVGKFFYPLTNGEHALIQNGKIEIVPKETMRDVNLKRFPDVIKIWYETETIPKQLICDITLPQIGDTFINRAPNMFKKLKSYESFSKKTTDAVDKMLEFIKEVWCDNNVGQLKYLLKWHSNLLKGKKNSSIIYVKSIEGVGKSTFTDFFIKYVLGEGLYAKGDKDCLCTSNNMDLLGMIYVIFEELPVLTTNEWSACDSKLKDMATGTEMNYSDKYCKKFRARNINNYVIITNHKAIKRPDGRRYHVVDIDAKHCNDHEYFGDLRNACFNEEVGYAFYNFLMEIDTTDFNSLDMPETRTKRNMIVDLLNPIENFLKQEYLLKNKSVKAKVKEFYNEYEQFCNHHKLRSETKTEFTTGLRQYGFNFKCICGYNCYRISIEALKTIATKRKWLHELDKDEMNEEFIVQDDDDEEGVDTSDKSVDISVAYTQLLAKYNQLLKQTTGKKIKKFDDNDDEYEEITIKRQIKRKGFGVINKDEEDYLDEIIIAKKTKEDDEEEYVEKVPKKRSNKRLSKKEISNCLDTLKFI